MKHFNSSEIKQIPSLYTLLGNTSLIVTLCILELEKFRAVHPIYHSTIENTLIRKYYSGDRIKKNKRGGGGGGTY
jgi:hypothetical protein